MWRTSGWSAALARTPRRARRLCPHPPAPAATVLAYSSIRLVTGLRPLPRPITGLQLEYRVRLLWCWYVLSIRCAALEARVVGGLLSAVSQDTGSHTKLTGNTGSTKEPVLPPG